MRYRALVDGDMTFGSAQRDFLINTPETVGQAVLTRLRLLKGEWYLDKTEGTPWHTEILGVRTSQLYDMAIRTRILETQGVTSIETYSSSLTDRNLSVTATINTIYGQTIVTEVL